MKESNNNNKQPEMGRTGIFEKQLIQWIQALIRSKGRSLAHNGLIWLVLGSVGTNMYRHWKNIKSIPELKTELQELKTNQMFLISKEDLIKIYEYCKANEVAPWNLTNLQYQIILGY